MPCSIRGSGARNRPSRLKKTYSHACFGSSRTIASAPRRGSCRGTAPLGARHRALVAGVACAPSGAPRPAPPAGYAPARLFYPNTSSHFTCRPTVPIIEPERRRWVTADGAPHLARSPSPVRVFFGRAPGGAVRGQDPPPEWRRLGRVEETDRSRYPVAQRHSVSARCAA